MNILICGGAGYIGSHMARHTLALGHACTVFDNLSTGFEWAVQGAAFIKGDLLDKDILKETFASNDFDAVMHFAAKSIVSESMTKPDMYYTNNVTGTLNLLAAMGEAGVNKFIFSSTAAVYGNPVSDRIDEQHPKSPINPYGKTKLMVEQILADYASAYGLNSVCLRYFNAAGADPSATIGEAHDPETHLIPNVLKSLLDDSPAQGFKVFGDDYDTPDGTCVRDYIHVNDLASAHALALDYLQDNPGAHAFNLGNKTGFSVLQVIKACEDITGKKVSYEVEARREGDPATLVADNTKAVQMLGWQPEYDSIDRIIATAWQWHSRQ